MTEPVGELPIAALPRLTVGKWIVNVALRWVPPFLPTLERAFGATTTQLTSVLGVGEMAGLSTLAVGRHLDRGRERVVFVTGIALVAIASLVALVGTTWTFAVGTVLVVTGVANVTVAGHAFISRRVGYERRGRAIGVFETSWAFALLVGAPVIAVLISLAGWRGPYVALALASVAVAVALARSPVLAAAAAAVPPDLPDGVDGRGVEPVVPVPDPARILASMSPAAWLTVIGSAFTAMAGLSIFAISGSWLDDAFAVPTGGLGAVAMGFGAIELVSSTSSSLFSDRIGKRRGTVVALAVLIAGAVVMALADETLWLGLVGILTFLLGFEFAIVTSFSLVSEATPSARGATLGLSNGVGTVARGTGTVFGGWLYGLHGVEGTLTLSIAASTIAIVCFLAGRPGPRASVPGRRRDPAPS